MYGIIQEGTFPRTVQPMLKYIFRKILRVIAILLGALVITFLLTHAIPGNPWSNYSTEARYNLNLFTNQATEKAVIEHYGLDLPLWRQFTRYTFGDIREDGKFVCGAVCGNLGPSISQPGRSVQHILFTPPEGRGAWDSRFGYSVRLVLFASLIAIGLGIPLGILSARKPTSALSRGISVSLALMISIPNFVLGLLVIIIFASWLKVINVLPDWSQPVNWIIPAFVLAVMPMASIARVTHASLVNTLNEDYVRTAHAKGLSKSRVMLVHVMRNASVPIVTHLAPVLMELFIGLLVVENLFAFPGFGREYWLAVIKLDYPLIMALTLIYAAGILLVNVGVEIICARLDPRIGST